jgi:hypothetical protein
LNLKYHWSRGHEAIKPQHLAKAVGYGSLDRGVRA